jgi:hypothetical protein
VAVRLLVATPYFQPIPGDDMLRVPLTRSALLMVTIAVAGCGGSSTSASKTTGTTVARQTTTTSLAATAKSETFPAVKLISGKPLTHAQWIAKADSICAHLYAQVEANTVRTNSDFARVLPQIAAYEQAALLKLAKIVPPASSTADWQAFLDDIEAGVQGSTKLGAIAQSGRSIYGLPLLHTVNAEIERRRALARRTGFRYCSLV